MLTRDELLLMFEMCLDGETRCAERLRAARESADHSMVAYEWKMQQQYALIKNRVHAAIARTAGAQNPDLARLVNELRADADRPPMYP